MTNSKIRIGFAVHHIELGKDNPKVGQLLEGWTFPLLKSERWAWYMDDRLTLVCSAQSASVVQLRWSRISGFAQTLSPTIHD